MIHGVWRLGEYERLYHGLWIMTNDWSVFRDECVVFQDE